MDFEKIMKYFIFMYTYIKLEFPIVAPPYPGGQWFEQTCKTWILCRDSTLSHLNKLEFARYADAFSQMWPFLAD